MMLFASHGGEGFVLLFIVAGLVATAATVAIFLRLYRARPSGLLRIFGMTYGSLAVILVLAENLFLRGVWFLLIPMAFVGLIVILFAGAIQSGSPERPR